MRNKGTVRLGPETCRPATKLIPRTDEREEPDLAVPVVEAFDTLVHDGGEVLGGSEGTIDIGRRHRRGARWPLSSPSIVSARVDVVVVEARDRVGGRTLNHSIGEGKVVEVGGQWVGPGQERILSLIDELGLETFDTYGTGKNLFEHGGRLSTYQGAIPKVNPVALMDVQLAMTRLERMARTVPPESPWKAPKSTRWDAETVASWTRRNMGTRLGRSLIGLACEAVWAADPADVSLLHFLAYCNSAGGLQNLISTDGGAQQSRIVGGSQRIAQVMADELGDVVILGEPVRRIAYGDGLSVSGDSITVRAAQAIVAMSPALAGRFIYEPALPAQRDHPHCFPEAEVVVTDTE